MQTVFLFSLELTLVYLRGALKKQNVKKKLKSTDNWKSPGLYILAII